MTKAVFTQKTGSVYDDLPEERYHFPRTYLAQVQASVGDWIVYYRPRRGASPNAGQPASTYFAIARVLRIEPDLRNSDLFYAIVDQYLELDVPVAFRRDEGAYETGLLKPDGSVSKGSFGRSVRLVSDASFDAILTAGFSRGPLAWEAVRDSMDEARPILEQVVQRPYRDRRFRIQVCEAYANTCAVTGLRLVNGGGRPEVQAAHIRPVEHGGPDSIRNGIALSGTAHWMFDRGLITVDEDMKLVLSGSVDPAGLGGLLVPGRRVGLPASNDRRPSPGFLEFHRRHVFHG